MQVHFELSLLTVCQGASYFRRAIASKHQHVCSVNGKCELNHKNRTMCKGCRLKRCMSAGMNPKAVQYNRDPIGSKKQRAMKPVEINTNYNVPSSSSSMASTLCEEASSTLLNRMVNAFEEFCKSERSLYAILFPGKPVTCVKDVSIFAN